MIQLLTRLVARNADAATIVGDRLTRLAESVPSEPGNLSYLAYRVTENPMVFLLIEDWESQTDLDRHVAKNEEDGVNEGVADLLTGPPETMVIRPLKSSKEVL